MRFDKRKQKRLKRNNNQIHELDLNFDSNYLKQTNMFFETTGKI